MESGLSVDRMLTIYDVNTILGAVPYWSDGFSLTSLLFESLPLRLCHVPSFHLCSNIHIPVMKLLSPSIVLSLLTMAVLVTSMPHLGRSSVKLERREERGGGGSSSDQPKPRPPKGSGSAGNYADNYRDADGNWQKGNEAADICLKYAVRFLLGQEVSEPPSMFGPGWRKTNLE